MADTTINVEFTDKNIITVEMTSVDLSMQTQKVDKVLTATENNFASFNAEGNIKDSGHKDTDYEDAGTATSLLTIHNSAYTHNDIALNTAARHSHSNKTELDKVTDGDHDIRTDNPHSTTKTQVGLSNVPNLDTTNAVNNQHVQNTDTKLDNGGANEVTAAQAKAGYTHSGVTTGNPHSVTKTDVGLSAVTNDSQVKRSEMGVALGVPTLDGAGKIPITQLPNAIMEYQGTWNATTNTPALADGETGYKTGDVYRVSVAGTQNLGSGNITFAVGDYCVYNGTTWEKSDTTDAVTQVNGFIGEVTLTADDIMTDASGVSIQDALDNIESSDVDSVNGQIGTVVLDAEDINIDNSGETVQSVLTDLESNKVDKVTGSSLVPDTEISKIHSSGSDNQTASTVDTAASGVSVQDNLDDLNADSHTHANKADLDLLSGTNTGDNATNSQYSGLVTNATHTGDVTGSDAISLIEWSSGNVTYVPLTGDIATYITAASAGDTLVLAAGTYTITSGITVNKKLHIMGQGEGITTITTSTADIDLITNTGVGSYFSDFTLQTTATYTTTTNRMVSLGAASTWRNVEFLNAASGSNTGVFPTLAAATSAIISIFETCSFNSSGNIGWHAALYNSSTSTVNFKNCKFVGSLGTRFDGNNIIYTGSTTGTVNLTDCSLADPTNKADGVISCGVAGSAINCYNCTINGSGATAFDVKQTNGTLTLYNTTLVNNTTSGTITYAGTVQTSGINANVNATIGGDISVVGSISGAAQSTMVTHSEIGAYLNDLTAPKVIWGITGTAAAASTELGYESATGRTWTYNGSLTADKITQGNTYVLSFDGTDEYLSTPDTADMTFADGVMSVGGWVQIVAGTNYQIIIGKFDQTTASPLREWVFAITDAEKLYFQLFEESTNKYSQKTSNAALSAGWHFVTITSSGVADTNITLYVDGVAVAGTGATTTPTAMEGTATLPVIGGGIQSTGSYGQFWIGDMGRLFVTAETLSAATVWKLYEKTRGFYNK